MDDVLRNQITATITAPRKCMLPDTDNGYIYFLMLHDKLESQLGSVTISHCSDSWGS